MFSAIASGAIFGINSYVTQIEVDTSESLPGFDMVGYLSAEVRESKERVKVALKNSGIKLPPLRITVNVSPANIRKEGTAFDLPIAVGILTSLKHIPMEHVSNCLILGELGLDGEVKGVPGVLPIVLEGKKQGYTTFLVPENNSLEGSVVDGVKVIGISTLCDAIRYLQAKKEERDNVIPPSIINLADLFNENTVQDMVDFSQINGQTGVKRAVEVAAAGFHHLLVIGPPGSGKTMVAKRIPGILPPLTLEESLEVSKIYSVSGLLKEKEALVTKRPFINPHHTISQHALAGGGVKPRPGAISLAHRGVLFLDELPEFHRSTIEIMRQPMEDKVIHIARSYGTYEYPADFQLVAAINPCPCGYYPDPNRCSCSPFEIKRYISKISGPMLDRIDICVEAPKMEVREMIQEEKNETSAEIRERVMRARKRQEERYRGTKYGTNSDLVGSDVKTFCPLEEKEYRYLERVFNTMNLSARAYHKIIKVARTIADLENVEQIKEKHLNEALMYRITDMRYWDASGDGN